MRPTKIAANHQPRCLIVISIPHDRRYERAKGCLMLRGNRPPTFGFEGRHRGIIRHYQQVRWVVSDRIASGDQQLAASKDSIGCDSIGGDTKPFAASLLHGMAGPDPAKAGCWTL